MRWCWIAVICAACGSDPGKDVFPRATQIASTHEQILDITGDGTMIAWITLASGSPSALYVLHANDTVPQKLVAFTTNDNPGFLVIVNHQPYWSNFVGETPFSRIFTIDSQGAKVEVGDGTMQLAGGDGAFLVRTRSGEITIADPSAVQPWSTTLLSDSGVYAFGAGKVAHGFAAGGGETIELGTGAREAFTYGHHQAHQIFPTEDGYFFYETGTGVFHATSAGTSQVGTDLGYGSTVAVGDDLWIALTKGGGELEPTTTALVRVGSDGSTAVRELLADTAVVFRSGDELMAVTRGVLDLDLESVVWRVDRSDD